MMLFLLNLRLGVLFVSQASPFLLFVFSFSFFFSFFFAEIYWNYQMNFSMHSAGGVNDGEAEVNGMALRCPLIFCVCISCWLMLDCSRPQSSSRNSSLLSVYLVFNCLAALRETYEEAGVDGECVGVLCEARRSKKDGGVAERHIYYAVKVRRFSFFTLGIIFLLEWSAHLFSGVE
jgi:8-oxo-dGTP pyrophosphatase MutT (NUDIX family)